MHNLPGTLALTLFFSPSLNHYWRFVGSRVLISRQGRAYRETVRMILAAQRIEPLLGILAMEAEFYPPDRRRRDLDNLQKSLWDALQHAGAYQDDSQIYDFHAWKKDPVAGGQVTIQLRILCAF